MRGVLVCLVEIAFVILVLAIALAGNMAGPPLP